MNSSRTHIVVVASTLFLIVSAAADVGFARLYGRSIARLKAGRSISARDVRLLARPIRLVVGQRVSKARLEHHLQQIGYYPTGAREPGCYASDHESLTVWARYPELPNVTLRWKGDDISQVLSATGEPLNEAIIEPETIVTLSSGPSGSAAQTSSVPMPFSAIADTPLIDAIVSSEDRWFHEHHGLDFPRLALTPLVGGGASTITMQVARLNVLQDRSRTVDRKLNEIGLAVAIERLFSKEAILTAYVNSVYLGASRGRAVHGFAAAAREFFGVHDIRELTVLQAATLVALLNQPSRYLDELHGGDDVRLRRQRNRVLRLMQKNFPRRYSVGWIRELEDEPVSLSLSNPPPDGLHKVSRHFLDYATDVMPDISDGRVYLTMDPDLQRVAADVVEQGLANLSRQVSPSVGPRLEAALIVTRPHTGEVLAIVGGRSYDESQFNRAVSAERQVGSIMKPFDFLAAFERAAAERRSDLSPATIVVDEPTVFRFPGRRVWKPANYGNDYAGPVTWRRALAESRNVATVKISVWAGFDRIAALWAAASGKRLDTVFPSIALGATQATPAEVARSYAVFATGGVVRPLRTTISAFVAGRRLAPTEQTALRVAQTDTTFRVTGMMRAVFDEGTARGARSAGFTVDAAGKTGTTDALRDAWFAGFTAELLAVVWVGRDDGQPLGLSGAQAALPIWTEFMKRALQGDLAR
jgi:penicillin-binding protein 1B